MLLGFKGENCRKVIPENCSNNGKCLDNKCFCNSGFTGVACEESVCPNNCNNNGICKQGKCHCLNGFNGKDYFPSLPVRMSVIIKENVLMAIAFVIKVGRVLIVVLKIVLMTVLLMGSVIKL
jgi:hypothetical protein